MIFCPCNSVFFGANDLTLCNINPYAKNYLYLKIASLISLDFQEYCWFFFKKNMHMNNNNKMFSKKLFRKIGPVLRYLNNDAFLYFDDLFDVFNSKGVRDNCFKDNNYHTKALRNFNIFTRNEYAYNKLRDTILTSSNTNITNLKQNQQYTLNYSYKQDNLTTSKVELIETISGNKVFEKTYNEQIDTITNETIPFIAEETAYIFKVTTSTTSGGTGGYFYIYDLMLNSGDKKNWEPAKSEVYSTVVKMSQMGLSVVAVGSNIITLLTSQGFQVRKYSNDQIGEIITEFTDKGIVTKDIDSTSISTGKYISTELMINGVEHHVEYFKE